MSLKRPAESADASREARPAVLADRPAPPHDPVVPESEPQAPERAGRRRHGGRLIVVAALLALVAGGGFALLVGAGGGEAAQEERAARPASGGVQKSQDPEAVDPLAPLPEARPKVVEPVAGETSLGGGDGEASKPSKSAAAEDDDMSLPKPKGPASDSGTAAGRGTSVSDLKTDAATALPNGIALPPLEAPEQVLNVIRAGNIIARSPYKWGGGHGRFKDNGYDCSGSVSYALYFAGLLDRSYTSGQLMGYGKPGKGRWITLYANEGHVFMEVAGIRFDTSGARSSGSRWQNEIRSTAGYVARHPPGL